MDNNGFEGPYLMLGDPPVPIGLVDLGDGRFAFRSEVEGAVYAIGRIWGQHANAWNDNVPAGGVSRPIGVPYYSTVTAFGRTSAPTRIILQLSQNGNDFYDGPYVDVTQPGDFFLTAQVANYTVRLKSTQPAVIVATLVGKS